MSFSFAGKVPVVAIMEHSRTISGRKDPMTGQSIRENVNLGWFIHLGFEGGTYAFRYGHEKPEGIAEGDILDVTVRKS